MTRPDWNAHVEDAQRTNATIERWVLRAQLAVIAMVVLTAVGAFVLITERAAQGVTECRTLKLAQCPGFLK